MSAQEPRRRERSQSDGLSEDDVFSMLSNQRRRYVIAYLDRTEGAEVSLGDLAERIAAWENDVDVAELTYKQRKRVYTSLHQTHLPKLDEAGVVDYDRDRGTITAAERAPDLDAYLSTVGGDDRRWTRRYLGLSALSVTWIVAAWLDVFPFALLSGLALAGVIVVGFATLAVAHARLAGDTGVEGVDAE
jgi:DNA-binding transcriptional ArsR family regulator